MGSRSILLLWCSNCLIGFILFTLLHSFVINVLLLSSLSTHAVVASSKPDYGYGVPCEEDFTCQNYSLLLQCSLDTQLCDCVKKSAVVLDESIWQCQVIAGKSCYRPNPNQYDDYYYEREYVTVPCVSHAVCQVVNSLNPNNKLCQCTSEYYANETGLCTPRRDFGEPCQYAPPAEPGTLALTSVTGTADQCDVNRYFACTPEGVCGCQPGLEYNSKLNTCYARVGTNCTKNDPAMRQNSVIPGKHDVCPLYSECFRGVCQCIPGFVPASDHSCRLSWGKTCNATKVCSDHQFVCRNGSCQCKYPLHQVHDKESGDCLSLVPGPCTPALDSVNGDNGGYTGPGGPTLKCVANAECIASGNTPSVGQCRCESRYKQDQAGHCVKPYGYDCELDSECQAFKTELVCVNGVCGCPDLLQKYDRERGVCVGLVGSRCQMVAMEVVKYKYTLAGREEASSVTAAEENDGNGGGWVTLDSEDSDDGLNDNYTDSNRNGNGYENGSHTDTSKSRPQDDSMSIDVIVKSWCVEGAECKPFGPSVQFGKIGECTCLDDWEPVEGGRCAKLFE